MESYSNMIGVATLVLVGVLVAISLFGKKKITPGADGSQVINSIVALPSKKVN